MNNEYYSLLIFLFETLTSPQPDNEKLSEANRRFAQVSEDRSLIPVLVKFLDHENNNYRKLSLIMLRRLAKGLQDDELCSLLSETIFTYLRKETNYEMIDLCSCVLIDIDHEIIQTQYIALLNEAIATDSIALKYCGLTVAVDLDYLDEKILHVLYRLVEQWFQTNEEKSRAYDVLFFVECLSAAIGADISSYVEYFREKYSIFFNEMTNLFYENRNLFQKSFNILLNEFESDSSYFLNNYGELIVRSMLPIVGNENASVDLQVLYAHTLDMYFSEYKDVIENIISDDKMKEEIVNRFMCLSRYVFINYNDRSMCDGDFYFMDNFFTYIGEDMTVSCLDDTSDMNRFGVVMIIISMLIVYEEENFDIEEYIETIYQILKETLELLINERRNLILKTLVFEALSFFPDVLSEHMDDYAEDLIHVLIHYLGNPSTCEETLSLLDKILCSVGSSDSYFELCLNAVTTVMTSIETPHLAYHVITSLCDKSSQKVVEYFEDVKNYLLKNFMNDAVNSINCFCSIMKAAPQKFGEIMADFFPKIVGIILEGENFLVIESCLEFINDACELYPTYLIQCDINDLVKKLMEFVRIDDINISNDNEEDEYDDDDGSGKPSLLNSLYTLSCIANISNELFDALYPFMMEQFEKKLRLDLPKHYVVMIFRSISKFVEVSSNITMDHVNKIIKPILNMMSLSNSTQDESEVINAKFFLVETFLDSLIPNMPEESRVTLYDFAIPFTISVFKSEISKRGDSDIIDECVEIIKNIVSLRGGSAFDDYQELFPTIIEKLSSSDKRSTVYLELMGFFIQYAGQRFSTEILERIYFIAFSKAQAKVPSAIYVINQFTDQCADFITAPRETNNFVQVLDFLVSILFSPKFNSSGLRKTVETTLGTVAEFQDKIGINEYLLSKQSDNDFITQFVTRCLDIMPAKKCMDENVGYFRFYVWLSDTFANISSEAFIRSAGRILTADIQKDDDNYAKFYNRALQLLKNNPNTASILLNELQDQNTVQNILNLLN